MATRRPLKPLVALAGLLVLGLGAEARAASTPLGVNLRWDNCFDDGGATNYR